MKFFNQENYFNPTDVGGAGGVVASLFGGRQGRVRVLGSRPSGELEECLKCGQRVIVAVSTTDRRYIIDPTPTLPGVSMGGRARRLVLWFFIDGCNDPVGDQRVELAPDDYDGRTWVEHHIVCGRRGGRR